MKFVRGVGCWGFGLLVMGAPSSGTAEPARPAGKSATPAAVAPLTAAPPARPQIHWRVDLARLARDITLGTNVTLDSLELVASTVNPGLRLDVPLNAASSHDLSRYAMAWRAPGAAALKRSPAAPELSAKGWFKLDGTPCLINSPAHQTPLEICGTSESVLAYADLLGGMTGPLPRNDAFEIDMDSLGTWRDSLEGLRGTVTDRVDDLLASPALAPSAPLRLGLLDLGYSLAARLTDAAGDLGRIHVSFAIDGQGAHYRSALEPRKGSLLEKGLSGSHAQLAPSAFWQLSDDLESAWFGSSSLLVPLVTPEARAVRLLASARGSTAAAHEPDSANKWIDALQSVASACLVADRTLIKVSGFSQMPKPNAASKAAKVFVPPPIETPEHHWSLGLEDPKSSCATPLLAWVRFYASLPPGKDSTNAIELVKPGKGVPPASLIVRVSEGKARHYAALSSRSGFSWLSWADTLPGLGLALQALNAPPAHRLASAPELAGLAKTPVLFGGFATGLQVPGVTAPSAERERARAPWWLSQDGAAWSIGGTLGVSLVRQTATQFLTNMWSIADWSKLDTPQRDAFTRFLDATCRLGNGKACNGLGVRYADGDGVGKDLDRAHQLLALGCAAGEGIACINSAFYGASPSEQLSVARRGCELKSALSCAWYGKWLLESHSLDDHPKGIKNLEFACDGASGLGCWQLADAYEEGIGVSKDEAKAVELQTRACTLRFAAGCIALGNQLWKGIGRAANPKLAFKAYELGCQLDPKGGCYALGFAYARGLNGEKDLKTARVQWTHACDAGHAEACRVLAETAEAP